MLKWMPCGSKFVEGDYLRWHEPVWKPKKRKTDRGETIGERVIVAQVIACGGEWADLRVSYCETRVDDFWEVDNYKHGELLRRRRAPLGKADAKTERREWSDESARSMVASVFFKAEPQAETRTKVKAEVKEPRRTGGSRYFRKPKRELKP